MEFGSDQKISGLAKNILGSHAFQRLRRISQLGLASFVFPGATHTRFAHCLGAAYLSHRVTNHLSEIATVKDRDTIEKHRVDIIAAALLHDLGHGPFSHSFEKVVKGLENFKQDPPKHEEWTQILIQRDKCIGTALRDAGSSIAVVCDFFTKGLTSSIPLFIRDIVSSQLDVDRMDYLVRDSHFAGVEVGRLDLWYLINCLAVVTHRRGTQTLGLNPKGVKAYEGFVLARQLMNRTLYYHRKIRALEFLMEHFLRSVIENEAQLSKISSIGPFVPDYFHRVAKQTKEKHYRKAEFLEAASDDYIALTEDVIWRLISVVANLSEEKNELLAVKRLAQKLLDRNVSYSVVHLGKQGLLKKALAEAGVGPDQCSVINVETTAYKKTESPVFVRWDDGEAENVALRSELIGAMADRPENESLLVIIDDDHLERIKSVSEWAIVHRAPKKPAGSDPGKLTPTRLRRHS